MSWKTKGRLHYLGLGDHVSYAGKQQIKAVYAVTMIFLRARSSFSIWFDGNGEKRFAKLDDNIGVEGSGNCLTSLRSWKGNGIFTPAAKEGDTP
jgi:hypothetical protein